MTKLLLLACFFVAIQQASNVCPDCLVNVSWKIIMLIEGIIVFLLGVASFIWFEGSPIKRILLAVMVPITSNVTQEIVMGSDRAYPLLFIALLVPYTILVLLGALTGMATQKR